MGVMAISQSFLLHFRLTNLLAPGRRENLTWVEEFCIIMFYPEDVRESVLKQILTSSKTVAAIARENNIPCSTVMTGKITAQKGKTMNKNFHLKKSLIYFFNVPK